MYQPFQTPAFLSYRGIVQDVIPLRTPDSFDGCSKMIRIETAEGGTIHWILRPDTYLSSRVPIEPGMELVGFYDSSLPVPLIYPPQFQAVALAFPEKGQQISLGYFDRLLRAEDNSLQLILGPDTTILTENGQPFHGSLKSHPLLVFYRRTTRSIPPQTSPEKIIVLCSCSAPAL